MLNQLDSAAGNCGVSLPTLFERIGNMAAHGQPPPINVSLPGVEREAAQALVDEAHQTCVYSKATRDSIDVLINLV